MEARLFLAACIMYTFTLSTRWLQKKNKLTLPSVFNKWHAIFLFLILTCALYVFLFVMNGGTGDPYPVKKFLLGEIVVLGISAYGFFSAKKADKTATFHHRTCRQIRPFHVQFVWAYPPPCSQYMEGRLAVLPRAPKAKILLLRKAQKHLPY